MSFRKSAPPLNLSLHRSRVLIFLLVLLHGGALFWAIYLVWPVWLKSVLVVLLVVSGWLMFRRHVLFVGSRVAVNVQCSDSLDWQLRLATGQVLEVQLHQSTYFPACLAVLNFRQAGRRRVYSVVVMFDSTDAGSLRRLGVKLRAMNEST